jgi:hypoxanthine phosphoribosyltransferase
MAKRKNDTFTAFGLLTIGSGVAANLITTWMDTTTGAQIGAIVMLGVAIFLFISGRKAATNVSESAPQEQGPIDLSQLRKVGELKGKLGNFTPDVVIGIARGGLIVAATLSKLFDEQVKERIPVISLYPDRPNEKVPPNFDHSLNHAGINPYFHDLIAIGKQVKVLIVDDAQNKGGTLSLAKEYVEKYLGTEHCVVETAVLSVTAGSRATNPYRYVDASGKTIWGRGE